MNFWLTIALWLGCLTLAIAILIYRSILLDRRHERARRAYALGVKDGHELKISELAEAGLVELERHANRDAA